MLQSGIPEDAFAAFATYQLQVAGALGRLQVGGGVRYTGKSFADDENTGVNKSVALFDALVAYDLVKLDPRFKGVRAQVDATNVFNRYYTTCIELLLPRAAGAGDRLADLPVVITKLLPGQRSHGLGANG